MSWVMVDDNFPHHPKVVQAGPSAGYLFVCGLCYCRKYHTSGFVPENALRALGTSGNPRKLAEALVAVGLWDIADGGYQVHDYAAMYPDDAADKTKKEEVRQKRRDAGRRGGLAKATHVPLAKEPVCYEQNPGIALAHSSMKEWGGSGVVSSSLQKEEKAPEPAVTADVWFRELYDAYPGHRRSSGFMTVSSFSEQFAKDERSAADVWAEMRGNLAINVRSHEWRIKGMVPKLEKYLREGLWRQQHAEAPVSTLVSEKTARTLASAEAFVRGGR